MAKAKTVKLTSPQGTEIETSESQAEGLRRLGYTTAQQPKPRKPRKPKAEPKPDD